MTTLRQEDIYLLMIASIFFLGMCTFLLGIFVLVSRTLNRDVRKLTNQTTQLAQKGITDNLTGLVGNTSALLDALHQLVKTTAGIGIFLTVIGLAMMAASYWLTLQNNWLH